jgi:lipoic acid synthetase
MILGDTCTRGCRYCAVNKGQPNELDWQEPERVSKAVEQMALRHVVITSVDRDDLQDGGAEVFAETIRRCRSRAPRCRIEVLIPDFQGLQSALETVLEAGPDVLGHNVETVPRLYPSARGGGDYPRSLEVLGKSRSLAPQQVTKTGLMLGLGETEEELLAVMEDLVRCQVQILTLGQYLRPSKWHLPVDRYYHPEEFGRLADIGRDLGFQHVEAGPLVRSSYLADRQFESLENQRVPEDPSPRDGWK